MTNGNDTVDTKIHGDDPAGNITIREHFAAMAMQGILASMPEELYGETREGYKGFSITAARATQAANALIEALNK